MADRRKSVEHYEPLRSPKPPGHFIRRLSSKSEADRKIKSFVKKRFKTNLPQHDENSNVSYGEIEFKGTKRRSKAKVRYEGNQYKGNTSETLELNAPKLNPI